MLINTITNADNREKLPLMPDASVDMILTDHTDGSTRNEWDEKRTDAEHDFLAAHYARIAKPNAVVAIMYDPDIRPWMERLGFRLLETLTCERMKTGPFPQKNRHLKVKIDVQIFCRGNPTFNPQFRSGKAYTRWRTPSTSPNYGLGRTNSETHSTGERLPTDMLAFPVEEADDQEHHLHPHQKQMAFIR